jgi:hypothetical protein
VGGRPAQAASVYSGLRVELIRSAWCRGWKAGRLSNGPSFASAGRLHADADDVTVVSHLLEI